jgi:hypothetical protein
MSVAFDIRWETVSAAMPIATSLSQNNGMAGWGWPMLAKILRSSVAMRAAAYKPAYSASAIKEHTTYNRDAGGVAGDGVVDPVIVVGEPEVAQATGDTACLGAGEEGGVR